jgi:hypothetical protein
MPLISLPPRSHSCRDVIVIRFFVLTEFLRTNCHQLRHEFSFPFPLDHPTSCQPSSLDSLFLCRRPQVMELYNLNLLLKPRPVDHVTTS